MEEAAVSEPLDGLREGAYNSLYMAKLVQQKEFQHMSKLSFIGFCIENYADAINRPGNEVYQLFKREGLLDLLKSDYEDLHGMGMEYMVQFCSEYLKGAHAI